MLIALVAIGGLQVLRGNQPQVSQATASAVALRQVAQMNAAVHGFAVVSASYDPAPDRLYDDRGNLIYSESHSSCPIWIFHGPAWLCHADGVWIAIEGRVGCAEKRSVAPGQHKEMTASRGHRECVLSQPPVRSIHDLRHLQQ